MSFLFSTLLSIARPIFGNTVCTYGENGMVLNVVSTNLVGLLEADLAGSMQLQHQKPSQEHVGTEARVSTLC